MYIAHRNRFLRLYQENKSSTLKVKFKLASNCCKRILEPEKLKRVLCDFWRTVTCSQQK